MYLHKGIEPPHSWGSHKSIRDLDIQDLPAMMTPVSARSLALYSLTFAPLVFAAPFQSRSSGLQWGPCDAELEATKVKGGYNGTIHCAKLTVPLDYTNKSSNATINLDLVRVPVPTGKSKGTLQFNFGGPGIAGRPQLVAQAVTWQVYVRYG